MRRRNSYVRKIAKIKWICDNHMTNVCVGWKRVLHCGLRTLLGGWNGMAACALRVALVAACALQISISDFFNTWSWVVACVLLHRSSLVSVGWSWVVACALHFIVPSTGQSIGVGWQRVPSWLRRMETQ